MTTFAVGDTATYLRGNHIIKFGGEIRRVEALQLQRRSRARSPIRASRRSSRDSAARSASRSATAGVQRLRQRRSARSSRTAISLGSNLKLDLGLRYDYIAVADRSRTTSWSTFDPATASLLQIGTGGFTQVHEERQRLPAARRRDLESDRRRQDRRSAARTRSWSTRATPATSPARPAIRRSSRRCRRRRPARRRATSGSTPRSAAPASAALAPVVHRPELPAGPHADVERQRRARDRRRLGVMVGYFGSHGDRLRIPININQFTTPGGTVRPYRRLSATSPILPGAALGNITEIDEPRLVATTRGCG